MFNKVTVVPPPYALLKGRHHLKRNNEPKQKGLMKRESLGLVTTPRLQRYGARGVQAKGSLCTKQVVNKLKTQYSSLG